MGFKFKSIGRAVGGALGGIPGAIIGGKVAGGGGGSGSAAAPARVGLSPEASKKAREEDFAGGLAKGKELIGEGSLGRLGTDPAIAQALEMQRGRLGGLTGAETQAQRDVATSGINRSTELARRRLSGAQAQAGVRGATAAQQQSNVLQSGIQQQGDFERQLLLGQRDAERQGIADVLGSGRSTKQFDLSQAARERFGQLQTALGFQQLGVSERAGVSAQNASIQAAQAGKPSGGLLGAFTGK